MLAVLGVTASRETAQVSTQVFEPDVVLAMSRQTLHRSQPKRKAPLVARFVERLAHTGLPISDRQSQRYHCERALEYLPAPILQYYISEATSVLEPRVQTSQAVAGLRLNQFILMELFYLFPSMHPPGDLLHQITGARRVAEGEVKLL
jgi:hypothetical protein